MNIIPICFFRADPVPEIDLSDDLLAAFPSMSRIDNERAEVRGRIEKLDGEIMDLDDQIARLTADRDQAARIRDSLLRHEQAISDDETKLAIAAE